MGGLSVVTRALLTGTPLTVLPGFDAGAVRAARPGRARPPTSPWWPTALRRLDPSVVRDASCSAGPPRPAACRANVVTTYGLTETGSGVVYDGRPSTASRWPWAPGSPGEGAAGEILVRGPMLLRAYRDGTDPVVAGPDGRGGWLPTGDGGRLDDGRLAVDGRLAEVVVTGGEKVWPAAVERVLAAQPGVAEVAVWKRPDPEWGERVVAWVVPADPARPPTLAELAEPAAATLSAWAAPKELVLVDALPRTPSGKVRRSALGSDSGGGGDSDGPPGPLGPPRPRPARP